MARIDFDKYRELYSWKIIQTDKYIFHIESSNYQNGELMSIIEGADKRHLEISEILEINNDYEKTNERNLKLNYWIHNSQVALDSGSVVEGKNFVGHGCASKSGIDYVTYNSSWSEHARHLLHEETHLIWIREVGEAPSILNEGIAVYVESLLIDGYEVMKERFCKAWFDTIGKEKGLLRNLMQNTYFWNAYGKISVYTLSGMLVFYIINMWGINLLKEIFSRSNYYDEKLAELIEDKTEISIEELEISITDWINNIVFQSS